MACVTLLGLATACGESAPATGSSTSGQPQPSGGGQSPNGTNQQQCSLPTLTDQYEGFRIGLPQGWNLTRIAGSLVVSRDRTGTTEVDIIPAVAANGLTASSFYTTVTTQIEKFVNSSSENLSFTQTSSGSGSVQATVSGQASGTPITGSASVTTQGLASKHGSQLLLFVGYWSPTSQLQSIQSTLAGIGTCFQLQKGQLLRIYRDQQFTYALPPNWKPNEQFNVLALNDPNNDASANFFFLETVPSSQGVTDAQSLLNYLLAHVGISGVNAIGTASSPSSSSVTGGAQQTVYEEFTATYSGSSVHGLASSVATTQAGATSGVIRLAVTRADLWNSMAGVVLQIAGGIQHSFVQDLGQIANVSRQWQNFDNQVAGFDDALNGVDIAVDPSTGVPYEVPYGDWDQNGPRGPGYYLPDGTGPLQVVTP